MAMVGCWEPDESRGSRPVLGARGGEIPPRDSLTGGSSSTWPGPRALFYPRPYLVRTHREQLRLAIDRMNALAAPLTRLALRFQKAVHGPNSAVITPFVERCSEDRRWRRIDKALAVEHTKQILLLGDGEGQRRPNSHRHRT